MRHRVLGSGLALLLAIGGLTGVASPASAATVDRISGEDRYATAVQLSQRVPSGGTVYVASGQDYPDALAGGAAASASDPSGAVLLVKKDSVPDVVAAEIARRDPARIVVLGGETAVAQSVVAQLEASTSAEVSRLSGADRYETAATLSASVFPSKPPVAYVASGQNYPDALAAGAAAGVQDGPILLTKAGELPEATRAELQRLSPSRIVVLGGPNAISPAVYDQVDDHGTTSRVQGDNRYATSAALSQSVFTSASKVYLASGESFPDALAGSPVAAADSAPILLVRKDSVEPSVCTEVNRLQPATVVALGGPNAISDAVLQHLTAGCPTAPQPGPGAEAAKQLQNGFNVPAVATSRGDLDALTVAPGNITGYSRDLFPHWLDADTWGWPPVPNKNCDVRQAALYREGKNVTYEPNCNITGGSWLDAYTNVTLYDKSDVDIDHIVALAEAWRSGAASWDDHQRRKFANDQLVVLAVDDGANQSKGDKRPDAWMPPNADAHCLYAKRWIAIKASYSLTVADAEKSKLHAALGTCSS